MSEFVRYTPENPPSERDIKIGKIKDLVGKIISNKSQDQVALTEKASLSSQVFGTLGYDETRVDNVETLINTSRDPNKDNKRAMDSLDILSTGIYEAMLDTKDEETEFILGVGSVSGIESQLPEDFKGIGRKVVDKVTENTEMTDLLIKLDNSRQRNKGKGRLGNDQISKKLEETYSAIDGMDIDEGNENGRDLVMTYLSIEAQILDGEYGVSVKKGARESVENSEGMRELASLLSSERAESTYDTFVTAEFLQQPIQLQVDTFPPSWFRNKPDNFRGSVADWQQVIRARINITNASYIKAEVAALDGEKAKNNNFLKVSEKELKIIYEMDGVRNTMQNIVHDFFKIGNSGVDTNLLVLKKENVWVNGIETSWDDALLNFRDYQESLVKNLVRDKHMDEKDARGAVAVAWNFLYISNVFESADTGRDIKGDRANVFGEQIRAMMHPLSKAKNKFIKGKIDDKSHGTEEGWGGNVGAWFADMLTWSDTRTRFGEQLNGGRMKPFPERIGVSMIDLMEVKTDDGLTMSLARALISKKKINFNKADSNLFGEYGDKWDSFFKYYYYSTGKNLIQFGKNLSEWSNGLADVLAKIRSIKIPGSEEQMFHELDTPEAFGWIMLNSVGIVRSPNLLLNVPEGLNYEAVVDAILQQPRLVPDKMQRRIIKRMLNGEIVDSAKRISIKWDSMRRSGKAPN